MSRAHALFLGAVGVIALHVIDDSFLQPQPGTSAGDHLAGGLVPLALLGLAVFAYPRVRAGAQAALAVAAGFFGIVVSVEAVHYLNQVGASGDDYTGCSPSRRGWCCSGWARTSCGLPAVSTSAAAATRAAR